MRRTRVGPVALSTFALLVVATPIIAQTGSMRVTVPSPTAATLGKFGDIPVSLYTGTPDISVPLFTAQGRTLALPIVLKYHAGGIKVEEIGGWAGIGWTLEAGGTITRTVRGLVDDGLNGYYSTGHAWYNSANWPTPSQVTLNNVHDEFLDGEPDQFFFDFAGRSGEFVIGPFTTDPMVKDYRAIPHQKLRIEPFFDADGITSFTITTEDGTQYFFGTAEVHTDFTLTSTGTISPHYGQTYRSSWHLSSITSRGGDQIVFAYTPYTARHKPSTSREKFDFVQTEGETPCRPDYVDVYADYQIQGFKLSSIVTAAHTITFTTTLRTDALSPYTGAQQEPRLDLITVATPAGKVLRRFQFEHDYSTGRLTLKNVYEKDSTGASLPPYTFTYDAEPLPPLTSFSVDHWGFYNGEANSTVIPPAIANGIPLSGGDRSPNVTFMKAGTLTRITYPTGGYNEFVYEGNDYGAVGAGGAVPIADGPIQSVVLNGGDFGPNTTTFTVGGAQAIIVRVGTSQDPSGCVTQISPPCPYNEIDGVGRWDDTGVHWVALPPGTYTMRSSAEGSGGYAFMTVEWRDRGPTNKKMGGGLRIAEVRTADAMGAVMTRKYRYRLQSDTSKSSGFAASEPEYASWYITQACTFYSRAAMSRIPLGGGPMVGYSEVTVLHGATGEFGKTRHVFRAGGDAPPSMTPYLRTTSTAWQRGQEAAATEYNAAGATQQRTSAVYAFPSDSQRVYRGLSLTTVDGAYGGGVYLYNAFNVISGWTYLSEDTTVVYDEAGANSFSSVRTYTYGNPVHLQLTQTTETNSNGTQRITRSRYPADYATGSGNVEAAAISAMQGAAHMHNAVIERWVTEKVGATETVLQANLTTYKEYALGQYLPYQSFVFNNPSGVTNYVPSSVTSGSFTKDSRHLLQETANTYDAHGRVTQLTDPRAMVTNYQYGGNANNAFLIKVTRVHDLSGAIDLVTDIAYDQLGFVSSIKDEGGTFRFFTYDLFGRLRQIKNNASIVTKAYGYTYSCTSPSWTFNPSSPNAVIDSTFIQQTPTPISVVSTGYADGLGRPIQTVVRDGTNYHVIATQYDLMGRSWRVWKPYTRTTAGYDAVYTTSATTFYNNYHATSNAKPYTESSEAGDAGIYRDYANCVHRERLRGGCHT